MRKVLGVMVLVFISSMSMPVFAQSENPDFGYCVPDSAHKEPCELSLEVWKKGQINVGRFVKNSGPRPMVKELTSIDYPKDAPKDYDPSVSCSVHGKMTSNVLAIAKFSYDGKTDQSSRISHAWRIDQQTGELNPIDPVQNHVVCYTEMP